MKKEPLHLNDLVQKKQNLEREIRDIEANIEKITNGLPATQKTSIREMFDKMCDKKCEVWKIKEDLKVLTAM